MELQKLWDWTGQWTIKNHIGCEGEDMQFNTIFWYYQRGLEPGVDVTTLLLSWLELLFFIILLRNLLKIVGCITTANWTCSVCLKCEMKLNKTGCGKMEIFLSFIFYSPHSFSTLDGKRKTRRTSADIVKLNRERRCLAGCKRDSRHKEKYKEDYERAEALPSTICRHI